MKKNFFIVSVMLILVLLFGGCKSNNSETDSINESDSVVFEDLKLKSGENNWKDFLNKSENGEKVNIRFIYNYTLEEQLAHTSSELYDEIKEEYPARYIVDLSFDGDKYHVHDFDSGTEKEYTYLKHYTGKPSAPDAEYSEYDCYWLVNDNEATYEQLEKSVYSSSMNDSIDHYRLYTDFK